MTIFSKKINFKFIGLLLLWLTIGSFGYWFISHFERVRQTIETGFQGKARDNPLLAAEYLLTRLGATVLTAHSFTELNNQLQRKDTLIFIPSGQITLDNVQAKRLLRWVSQGGYLIAVSDSLYDDKDISEEPDPLLQLLQLYQYENQLKSSDQPRISPTLIQWDNYQLRVAFYPNYRLESSRTRTPETEISDHYGTHLVSYQIGHGLIRILSDLWFIENDAIGKYDHAQFLWHLVNRNNLANSNLINRIWLFHPYPLPTSDTAKEESTQPSANNPNPSLWQLLWSNAWTLIISAACLLLAWLWLIMPRFGPLLPPPPHTRRRLLEHLEASGEFFWRQRHHQTLLFQARQALFKRLQVVHPEWLGLPPSELSRQLTDHSNGGHSRRDLEAVLTLSPSTIYSEATFTHTIQLLTHLRKQL